MPDLRRNDVRFVPGCTGKVPYFTKGEALSTMRRWKTRRGSKEPKKSYHCKSLEVYQQDHWHITTKGLLNESSRKKTKGQQS